MPNTSEQVFTLHPQLAADSLWLIDWPLCQVRLMQDARFPWLILVPRQANLRELHELSATQQNQVWQEVCDASLRLQQHTEAIKMNVAALGNLVPQLHIHVIARFTDDAAWPNPVWGQGSAQPYEAAEQEVARYTAMLG